MTVSESVAGRVHTSASRLKRLPGRSSGLFEDDVALIVGHLLRKLDRRGTVALADWPATLEAVQKYVGYRHVRVIKLLTP